MKSSGMMLKVVRAIAGIVVLFGVGAAVYIYVGNRGDASKDFDVVAFVKGAYEPYFTYLKTPPSEIEQMNGSFGRVASAFDQSMKAPIVRDTGEPVLCTVGKLVGDLQYRQSRRDSGSATVIVTVTTADLGTNEVEVTVDTLARKISEIRCSF